MTDIQRDRWGRPLITPPGDHRPVGYTRVSTLAKALDDLNNLMAWQCRKTIEGLLRRPDLLTEAAGILANGDPDNDWPTKRDLNNVAERAREAAGASKGSTAGTGFHALTEAHDHGRPPAFVPPADVDRLRKYVEATAHLEMLDIECFVVNDEIRAAGTFDRLVRDRNTGRVMVADLKSGKSEAAYPLSTTIQLATYANSSRYDAETEERSPLHPDLDLTTGLLIHLPPPESDPFDGPAEPRCDVIPLDLERGWEAARLAARIHHEVRKWKPADLVRRAVSA